MIQKEQKNLIKMMDRMRS